MSHFLDGTAYGGHINLVRLLNANSWMIWEMLVVTYGCDVVVRHLDNPSLMTGP